MGLDAWEHAAAVRELAAHPLHPAHPLLPVDRPHQYFSPYLLIVGIAARVLRLDAITALGAAGIFNLVLLLAGLRLFVNRLIGRPHVDFYALLFMLCLWGPGAWAYSGFLHFGVLFSILSYPSTFVKGLLFFSLLAHINYLESDRKRWLLPTLVISVVTVLTHPIDQVSLTIGLVALAVTQVDSARTKRVIVSLGVVAAAVVVSVAWPYMSITHIVVSPEAARYRREFRSDDAKLYSQVLPRFGLALLVVPFVWRRMRSWRGDPLVVMFAGLLLLYLYGYLVGDPVFGRLASSLQVVVAIVLAQERVMVPDRATSPWTLHGARVMTVGVVLAGFVLLRQGLTAAPRSVLARVPFGVARGYVLPDEAEALGFVGRHHQEYPVVFASRETSLEIPVFGSKVVDEIGRASCRERV